ncbi:MAG TPA: hypothetical protein VE309_12140, partial [Caulobacteraceae bacterium]|nr:hypothetical protein [Caulobacteraceae bacterium]
MFRHPVNRIIKLLSGAGLVNARAGSVSVSQIPPLTSVAPIGGAAYLSGMNSETHEELLTIARDAGAILTCAECGNYDIRSWDGDAKNRAFAMATQEWKRGRFGASPREEIIEAM